MSFSTSSESFTSVAKEGPYVLPNLRYLADDIAEIFTGDNQGTVEVIEVKHYIIPNVSAPPLLVYKCTDESNDEIVSCVDFPGHAPYVITGTTLGTVNVVRERLNCPHPFVEKRCIFHTPDNQPVLLTRLNPLDAGFACVAYCTDTRDYVSVVDLIRQERMEDSVVIVNFETEEEILDCSWTWRHPALLAVSSDRALRIFDIRTADRCPQALFFDGAAKLLTPSKFKPEVMAALIGKEIQLFDTRKLAVPMAKYKIAPELDDCEINVMKWHPRLPDELHYYSTTSPFIAKLDTSGCRVVSKIKIADGLDKSELMSIDRTWDFSETEQFYVDMIVKKRHEQYPQFDEPVLIPTYEDHYEKCSKDNSEEMPLILNPMRTTSFVKPQISRGTADSAPDIKENVNFPGEVSPNSIDKEQSTERGDVDVKLVKMYSFVSEAGIEARSNNKEMLRRASLQSIFNGAIPIQPNKYFQKYQQLATSASVYETMIINSHVEDPVVYETTDRTSSPVISRKMQKKPCDNSPEVKALKEDKRKCVYWDPLKALKKLNVPEDVMDEARIELHGLLPVGTSISVEAVNSLTTLAMSRLKAVYKGRGILTGTTSLMGLDVVNGYRLKSIPQAFAFPGYGVSGVTFLHFGPTARIQFVQDMWCEEETYAESDYTKRIEMIRLHELYKVTPPKMFPIFSNRLAKRNIHPKNMNHIDLITMLQGADEDEDVRPDPWWLIWAAGSSHYYEGPIRSTSLFRLLRKQRKETHARRVIAKFAPRRKLPEKSALISSSLLGSTAGTSASKSPASKKNRRVSFSLKSTSYQSNPVPAFYKAKTERDAPLPIESDEKLPMTGLFRIVPPADKRRRIPLRPRKIQRKKHTLKKNKKFHKEVRQHSGIDMEFKGFPGLLQLMDMEIQKEATRLSVFDASCIEHLKLYCSPYRTRMLIPFRVSGSDNMSAKLRPDGGGIQDFLEVMYCSFLNGRFAIFVQVIEEIGKVFAVPNSVGGEYSRHAWFLLDLVKLTRKFIDFVSRIRPRAKIEPLSSMDSAIIPWVDNVDEFMEREKDLLQNEYALVVPCLVLMRLEVTSSQQPEAVREKILRMKKIPFHFRLLWLVRTCSADVLRKALLRMFHNARGMDRLIYVGLGRHNDCLSVLADHFHTTHDFQLIAHLLVAGRILEEDENWLRVVSDVLLTDKTRVPHKGSEIRPVIPEKPENPQPEVINPLTGLPFRPPPPPEKKKKSLQAWMFEGEHKKPPTEIIEKYLLADGGKRKIYKFLKQHQRLPPLFHMNEVFHNKYIPGIVPVDTLLAVCRKAVLHYLVYLGIIDGVTQDSKPRVIDSADEPPQRFAHGAMFRYYFLKLSGNTSLRNTAAEESLHQSRCQFCGMTRTDPKKIKPAPEETPEDAKKRMVIKDRADRRRQALLQDVENEKKKTGEPVVSYVPFEDVGGSMATTEVEMKTPPLNACPHCHKSWGRCIICQRIDRTEFPAESEVDHVSFQFVVCKKCHHGGHMKHIHYWFRRNPECAVNGCSCKCYRSPMGEMFRMWAEEDMGFRPTATFEF